MSEAYTVEDLLRLAIELAPQHATARKLFEAVNERLEIDKSPAAWRGIVNRNPEQRDAINALLRRPTIARTTQQGEPFDVEKFFELTIAASAEWKKRNPSNDRLQITIDTDAPIGIVFTSDWHVGGSGTEHLQIKTDNELIAAHPLLYAYVGGDWANNFIIPALAHAGANDIFSAGDQQYEIVTYLLRILAENNTILAIGDGNHDGWTRRLANLDPRMHVLRDLAHLYTAQGSLLELTVGKQTYRIFRRHRHRWSSVFNPGHAVVSEYQRNPYDFDIGVIEHQHEPHFSGFHGKERADGTSWRLAIRPGTYKTSDAYANEFGYYNGSSDLVSVILHPHRFWMQPVRGLENAIEYLDSVA
jgi:hypothetical protein